MVSKIVLGLFFITYVKKIFFWYKIAFFRGISMKMHSHYSVHTVVINERENLKSKNN